MIGHSYPPCPVCGESDQVEKVSAIYLETVSQSLPTARGAEKDRLTSLSKEQLAELRGIFAPPSSGKRELTRYLHPDLVIVVFSGIMPVFLAGIARSQRNLLLPVLLALIFIYILYLSRRKALIARYEGQIQAQQEEKQRVERAVGRWMKLYFCIRDQVVFEDGGTKWASVELVNELFLNED